MINIETVLIGLIVPNKWNFNVMSPDMLKKEVDSIQNNGYLDPITVREVGGKNKVYEVIDGEHRLKACKKLGFIELEVNNLGEMDDIQAKKLTILFNEIKGESDAVKLGKLMKELEGNIQMSELPYTKEEIDKLVSNVNGSIEQLLENEGEVVAKDKEKKLDIKMTELKFSVTEEQASIINRAIKRVMDEEEIKSEGRALELISADYLST